MTVANPILLELLPASLARQQEDEFVVVSQSPAASADASDPEKYLSSFTISLDLAIYYLTRCRGYALSGGRL